FLMAEFLGRSYFDVVARGYAPAIIYYVGVSVSVYLLSTRHRAHLGTVVAVPMKAGDWANIAAFGLVVGGLMSLMGIIHMAPMFAALYMFVGAGIALILLHSLAMARDTGWSIRGLLKPLGRLIEYFAEMTSDLALLLATLSIMTGALVITGVPTKIGSLLIAMAGVNMAGMVIMAFFFGALLGTGLPPAPTYIITALVIAPPMIKVGVDPWVVHFFAFFLGVWGELTPPTSVAAAVTSKIAEAPFMRTLFDAITICVSLFTLMAGVFTRPELVVEPGIAQLAAMGLVMTATVGITFSIQGRFSDHRARDIFSRIVLAAFALIVLLHPNREIAVAACVPVGFFIAYWVMRRRGVPVPAPSSAA
ncbi:MAG TPA: TRAP transporter large permease subunit, partial [Burkholderiales bacterium]|nr:TRAP transporter large permease subunit [Burkholderiales bacterium]